MMVVIYSSHYDASPALPFSMSGFASGIEREIWLVHAVLRCENVPHVVLINPRCHVANIYFYIPHVVGFD
jgi:hypothetical protein